MKDIQLSDFGSFFVGGESVITENRTPETFVLAKGGVPVTIDPNGTTMLGQMYVQFAKVRSETGRPPLAFWHGGSMSGVTWESTPDGRDGWFTHFLRQGWCCYNVDAVERGRSGWAPLSSHFEERPFLRTFQDCFSQFRLGQRVTDVSSASLHAAAYPNCQFPLEAFLSFMKQVVPRWVATDDLALDAYCDLLCKIGPTVIIAHSQGGAFAFRAAERHPDKVAAIVAIEPAQGGTTDGAALAGIPVLAIYGDHIDIDDRWPKIRKATDAYFSTARHAGAHVDVMDLPALGIRGNSHMMMMENNNIEIATLIEGWLRQRGIDQ